ncbi:MAG TPA: hypothetical protein VMO26_00070 [Vicinamibacterales bacterium]|nr:hypothetical protein [Vicinamibacterales bacterium]
MSVRATVIGVILLIVVGVGAYVGYGFVSRLMTWRHLDQTYQEQFTSPAAMAPELNGRKVTFHIKTGLDQDDSQICVGFNIILASIEAGADTTVVFDAGALLDLTDKKHNLESTGVPLRLKKVIAAQTNLPLEQMPNNYREYLELLHQRGAAVYANTAMLIVTGDAAQVAARIAGYDFIEPVAYARLARLLAQAESVIVY